MLSTWPLIVTTIDSPLADVRLGYLGNLDLVRDVRSSIAAAG